MKKSLLISLGLIALMAAIIAMPWEAYLIIGIPFLVMLYACSKMTTRNDARRA